MSCLRRYIGRWKIWYDAFRTLCQRHATILYVVWLNIIISVRITYELMITKPPVSNKTLLGIWWKCFESVTGIFMNFSISCKLKKKSVRTINEARRQGQKSSSVNKTRGIKSSYNNLQLFFDTAFDRDTIKIAIKMVAP